MSVRVVDPSGSEWTVSREWLGLPSWTRFEGDWPFADAPTITTIGDDVGGYGGLALLALVVIVAIVLLWLLVPILLFVAGVAVTVAALVARLLGLSEWTVRAHGQRIVLIWRVRGLGRSRRAMDEIVALLAAGQKPTVDGVAGEAR